MSRWDMRRIWRQARTETRMIGLAASSAWMDFGDHRLGPAARCPSRRPSLGALVLAGVTTERRGRNRRLLAKRLVGLRRGPLGAFEARVPGFPGTGEKHARKASQGGAQADNLLRCYPASRVRSASSLSCDPQEAALALYRIGFPDKAYRGRTGRALRG